MTPGTGEYPATGGELAVTGAAAGALSALSASFSAAGAARRARVDELLTWVEHLEGVQRALDAARSEFLGAAVELATEPGEGRSTELEYRSLRAEAALLLGTSERAAEARMDAAYTLRRHYRSAHSALASGEITATHARVIVDSGLVIGAGDASTVVARRAAYEREVLVHARVETANRLRPIARRLAEEYAERTLDERHEEAVRQRRVVVTAGADGMSELTAVLPTIEAFAIHDRLTRIAREVDPVSTTRMRDQVRADVLCDLVLGGSEAGLRVARHPDGNRAGERAIDARVQVIVPWEALHAPRSGNSAPVAELVGAGPVPLQGIRALAASSPVWQRVVTQPQTADVLSVDRYRPSASMRRRLGARDQHCRFPGCRVPVARCDLDHTVDAALGGATATDNLAHLCRGHHVLKHHSDWRVRQGGDGVLHWTSPAGRAYADRPPGRVRFARSAEGAASAKRSPGDDEDGEQSDGDAFRGPYPGEPF
ncbi:HNH endonuclease signature motif containing protein [Leucobacter musarum]|uniref:HNH endonuclease signature motif containing protein n=1 Tax=Leucobacter musarum TaxID=1930747 RepID=UPI0006A7DAF8|nr:HNH endonuclease signature motif containing protein [Leucobacter musarum]